MSLFLNQKIQLLSITKLKVYLVLISAAIASIILYNKHGVTDPDSVLYLEAARLFALSHWQEAYEIYPWPFYSLCIALAHKTTGLSIFQSAVSLNIVFFTLTAFSFLKIIELCGGKKLEMLMGALILFSSTQIVGNIVGNLMRDIGFWAFLLTALAFFMRFYKSRTITDAFYWQLSIIIATMFRIEGISFLILLPFSLLDFKNIKRLHNGSAYLKANFLSLAALILICCIALMSTQISTKDFGRLQEILWLPAYQALFDKLSASADIMSSQVLGKFLQDYATQGLMLTILYAIFSELIKATGRLNSLLGLLGLCEKTVSIDEAMRRIVYFAATIAALNFAVFTIKTFVITHRYVLPFSFIWMIFSAFYLAYLCQFLNKPHHFIKKISTLLIIVFLSVSFIKHLLPKSHDIFIQQEAVTWLKKHNHSNAPIFYDESRARYYANEPFMGKFNRYDKVIERHINNHTLLNHQYLLLTFSKDDLSYEELIRKSIPMFIELKRFCFKDQSVCSVIFMKK